MSNNKSKSAYSYMVAELMAENSRLLIAYQQVDGELQAQKISLIEAYKAHQLELKWQEALLQDYRTKLDTYRKAIIELETNRE